MAKVLPMKHAALAALAMYATFVIGGFAPAADWPMFRGDAGRTGYSPEPLPAQLSLQWVYRPRHAPAPAWPSAPRLAFDHANHVAVAGGAVFFGGSADGKVTALEAESGAVRWEFFTEGPVRFAPAVWRDQVFAASDDGYLYCLSARDGRLLWKRRGGPDDSRRLGNDRMISRWPARGGPAVLDGVVYFAAGIWPSEGIYIYALDAKSGEPRWLNDDSGSIYMAQPHGGANAASGVAAQGHLAVAGDRLFLPTGRAVPAVFDRASGKLAYFHLQRFGHAGGADMLATAEGFFNSGLVFDAKTGDSQQRIGVGALAASPEVVVRGGKTGLAGFRWDDIETKDRKGATVRYRGLKPVWAIPDVPGGVSLILTGQQAVSGGPDGVLLVDLKSKKTTCSLKVGAAPLGLAAAGGRLYVSDLRGWIHCYGDHAGQADTQTPETSDEPFADNGLWAEAAQAILERSGVSEGYCLDLGCGEGRLAYELAKRSKLHIVAVDADAARVAEARRKLDNAGLYGNRLTVLHMPADGAWLPNYFADLVVSGRSVTAGAGAVSAEAVLRPQRPFGGAACLGGAKSLRVTTRGPLAGAGNWTHQYANAANTLCSTDTRIKGPLRMLWFRDADLEMPQRHGRGPAPLFYEGRLFHEGLNALRAVDAYNGRTLWQYELPGVLQAYNADHLMGASGTGSNYCVGKAGVFIRQGGVCLRLDAATGKKLGEFAAPKTKDGQPGVWGYLAQANDTLFASLADTSHVVTYAWRKANMDGMFTESTALLALHPETGKPRWTYQAKHSIRHNAIAIGADRVYLIDRAQAAGDKLQRRGKAAEAQPSGELVCLNCANRRGCLANVQGHFWHAAGA